MLLALIGKELLLLRRDRGGLLVLFVMPVLLVLVLSLLQDNLFRATGETASRALLVNRDRGDQGAELARLLAATGTLDLVEELGGKPLTTEKARRRVHAGDYQFALVIPADFSEGLQQRAVAAVRKSWNDGKGAPGEPLKLQLLFDPTVRGVYRSAVTNALQRGLLGLESARKGETFGRLLPQLLQQRLQGEYGDYAPDLGAELPRLNGEWLATPLLGLQEESAYPQRYARLPTSVQQNVPAWTLFGMFFIVIPLAGTLIRERQEGTLRRLLTMPVNPALLLLGKMFAYQLICLLQLLLMLAVGRYLLPLLGAPVLEIGSSPLALLLLGLSAALAACSYGILVGTLARSYEQASTFGAVSVVIAAAMGGVMVPVYVMPRLMQQLSVLSPLNWGLEAFLDVFVRGAGVAEVLPHAAALWAFATGCLLLALVAFSRQRNRA